MKKFISSLINFQSMPSCILLGIISCIFAINIFIFPAADLNQDMFYYMAIGNKYLLCGQSKLQDAFTVGIVLPQYFRAVGYLTSYISHEKLFQLQVLAAKFLVVACYATLILVVVLNSIKKNSLTTAVFLLALTFLWADVDFDIASLNGEILSVTLIILIKYLLDGFVINSNNKNIVNVLIIVLVVMLANVKIQALPLAFLAIFLYGKQKKYNIAVMSLMAVGAFDLWLYNQGAGFIYRISGILLYLGKGNATNDGSLYQLVGNIKVMCKMALINYPLLGLMIADITLTKLRKYSGIDSPNKLIALFLMAVVTMCIPGREFKHYTVFMLVPLLIYIESTEFKVDFDNAPVLICLVYLLCGYHANNFVFRLKEWRNDKSIAYNINKIDISELKAIIPLGSTVFVNGWDYSLYTRLGMCFPDDDFASMYGRQRTSTEFYNKIFGGGYRYIIDAVGVSGLPVGANYKISKLTGYEKTVRNSYSSNNMMNGYILYSRR